MLDRTSDFINLSRWAAALVVVASHLRQIIMQDYSNITNPSLFIKAFYFVTQLGHEAVMVFFVISGYLIGGISILRYKAKGFDGISYASHRIARIYAAFLPALVIFSLVDAAGANIFEDTGLYNLNLGIASMHRAPSQTLTMADLIGNAAMLQYGVVDPFGSNGPLWSLAYEWWYYVLFGFAMLSLRHPKSGAAAIILVIGFLPFSVLAYGLIWLLGACIAWYGASTLSKPPLWMSLPLFFTIILFARITHISSYDIMFSDWRLVIDFCVALAFSFVFLSYHRMGNRLKLHTYHKMLADFSYSLYLTHFPLMLFVVAAISYFSVAGFMQQPGITAASYYLSMLAFLLGFAWLFAQFTEEKTPALRSKVEYLARRYAFRRNVSEYRKDS